MLSLKFNKIVVLIDHSDLSFPFIILGISGSLDCPGAAVDLLVGRHRLALRNADDRLQKAPKREIFDGLASLRVVLVDDAHARPREAEARLARRELLRVVSSGREREG